MNDTVKGLPEKWRAWFAWHPVCTIEGRFAFLRRINRRWIPDYSQWLAPSPAHWEYSYDAE